MDCEKTLLRFKRSLCRRLCVGNEDYFSFNLFTTYTSDRLSHHPHLEDQVKEGLKPGDRGSRTEDRANRESFFKKGKRHPL